MRTSSKAVYYAKQNHGYARSLCPIFTQVEGLMILVLKNCSRLFHMNIGR